MGKKLDRRRKAVDELGPATMEALKEGRVVSVGRREALIGQLTTAIGLWLDGRDALSIHLIGMAAHRCLCDLGYPSELEKIVGWEHFGMAYDWLRHAKSDPHDGVIFAPRANEIILWECCVGMRHVFGGSTVQMDAFTLWAALHLFPEQPSIREQTTTDLPEGLVLSEIEGLNLNDFLAKVIPVIAAVKLRSG
jgi:hypothetical protein